MASWGAQLFSGAVYKRDRDRPDFMLTAADISLDRCLPIEPRVSCTEEVFTTPSTWQSLLCIQLRFAAQVNMAQEALCPPESSQQDDNGKD